MGLLRRLLLNEFLAQDCDAAVRQNLLAEITNYGTARVDVVRKFTLNRFNVRLDFQSGEVKVEDELDTREQGSCSLSLTDFTAALDSHSPRC
jgi:hypothetical protein